MKKVIMVVLGGLGISDSENGNAVKQADMDCFDHLYSEYPKSLLRASGEYVGLPDNQFGNSEVGFLSIGAGKKIKQDVLICNENLGNPDIEDNILLNKCIEELEETGGRLHLAGLVSDGLVHSDIKYMMNLIGHLKNMGLKELYFHVITDGLDVEPNSAKEYIKDLEDVMKQVGLGVIADVCGRFYAMDRDNNWERTKVYSDLLLKGKAAKVPSYTKAIDACYKENITDDKLPPFILDEKGKLQENDKLIWLNFRADRSKQILNVLLDNNFKEYLAIIPKNFEVITVVETPGIGDCKSLIKYEDDIYPLGVYFSELGLSQARISESLKYSSVSYYFDGAKEVKLKGCDYFEIPSVDAEDVLKNPELSAREVTKQAIKCLDKDYDFILVNFANPDILAHTGDVEATVKGLEVVDDCLEEILESVNFNFYHMIVTSDHGNCEEMLSKEGETTNTHSLNPVPFILLDNKYDLKHKGDITQIAPTILKYMDIAIPKQMQGTKSLFIEED